MRALAAFLALGFTACADDPESAAPEPEVCDNQVIEDFIAPFATEVQAAGRQMVDCTQADIDLAADCVQLAMGIGNAFRVTWTGGSPEVVHVYVGGASGEAYVVHKLTEAFSTERQGFLYSELPCSYFQRKSTCQVGQFDDYADYCFFCFAEEDLAILCDDREPIP